MEKEALHINYKYLDYKTEIKTYNVIEQEDYKFSGIMNKFIDDGGNYVIKVIWVLEKHNY